MATLTVQTVTSSGVTPTYVSAAVAGDQVANPDGDTFVHVKNTSTASKVVTVTAQQTSVSNVPGYGTLTKSSVTVTVPATTGDKLIGPFPLLAFNNASGRLAVTYSAVTSLTIAALRLPKAS